ncbi:MAG: DUF502 domain-containing protein [Planctomycetota bacterium]
MSTRDRGFGSDFRKFFFRGLGILLPSVVTVGLLVWAFGFLQVRIAGPINAGVRFVVLHVVDDVYDIFGAETPSWYVVTEEELASQRALEPRTSAVTDEVLMGRVRRDDLSEVWVRHWYLEGIGFILAVIAIYLAGVFFGNFLGKRIYQQLEHFFVRLPIIKQVYPNVKQITDFLVGDEDAKKQMPGSKVVLVEYPRQGIWTIGLLTGESMDLIEKAAGTRLVTVFIPSSPTPFTGYTINVPLGDVVEVGITMDEAIRFVVSGGVLVPDARRPKRFREGLDHDALARVAPSDLLDDQNGTMIEGEGEGSR